VKKLDASEKWKLVATKKGGLYAFRPQ